VKLRGSGSVVRLVVAAACLLMGVLSLVGVFSSGSTRERWIIGVGWIVIGAGWLARCYLIGSPSSSRVDDEGERPPGDSN